MENELELTDQQLDEYIDLALSNATAVGPKARKQLHGLLRYYAKKKHPFTACVRDNTKRFGKERAERVCAVLKDIIRGTTKWRGKNNPKDKGVTKAAMAEEFALDLDETTQLYLDEELQDMVIPEVALSEGDIVWKPEEGFDNLRRSVQEALNDDYKTESGETVGYSEYWVEDIASDKALVCYKGSDYYVVPFTYYDGDVHLADEEEWKPVEKAWVEANLSQEPQMLAEMFLEDENNGVYFDGKWHWKTVLREGQWAYSPGPGGIPIKKPITVVKDGTSDGLTKTISIAEIVNNFKEGAVENVTIPETHADKSTENTGFVREVKMGEDEKGRATLEAAFEFTEPEVEKKVKNGSIANTSAGILFDYIKKDTGNKYNAVMAHAALTNHPWLNDMKPFGVEASENVEVVAFSEENVESPEISGGDIVSQTTEEEKKTQNELLEKLGLSEDEIEARLSEYSELKAGAKKREVEDKVKAWQDKGVAPAVLTEVKAILMADDGAIALHLSEDGKDKPATATELAERIVNSIPVVNLAEDHGAGDRSATEGSRPADDAEEENKYADLSLEDKSEAASLMFTSNISEEEAIKRIRDKKSKE